MSRVALFDEPLRVSIVDGYPSRNGLLVGIEGGDTLRGIVCMEDGSISYVDAGNFTIDYRYDVLTDRWVDITVQKPDQTDQLG